MAFITADHGNAEVMEDEEGRVHVAHTTNLVPFIAVGLGDVTMRSEGTLADIAPTVLGVFGIDQVEGMRGKSLML